MAFELGVTKQIAREKELQARNLELQKAVEEYRQAQEALAALNEKLEESLKAKALEESQAQLRLLSDVATHAYNAKILFDKDYRVVWANSAFVQLMGYTLSEAQAAGKRVILDIVGGNQALFESLLQELEHKFSLKREIYTRRKDGTYFWSLTTISSLLDEAGRPTHYLVTLVDIMDLKLPYLELQEKVKEFEGSLVYAERIQKALLPTLDVAESYGVQTELYYEPKYKIGGDFVWGCPRENGLYLGVGDSTGHGIPGAMLGMLFLQLLKEGFIMVSHEFRQGVPAFHQKLLTFQEASGLSDSLELSVVFISNEKVELFTTSNQRIYVQNLSGQVEEIAMKARLGKELLELQHREPIQLGIYEIPRAQVRRVYLLTDGIRDQLGESEGKRFGSQRVRAVLGANSHENLKTVLKELKHALDMWRGDREQVDDYLLLAIELS